MTDHTTPEDPLTGAAAILEAGPDRRLAFYRGGAGKPVLLVPSQGRGAEDFRDLAGRLIGAGFQVILTEPRGIGDSRGPREGITLHDLAADGAAVIESLDLGPVDVVGHAFGNRITRALASDRPDLVRRIVLIAAGGLVPGDPEVVAEFPVCFDLAAPNDRRLAAIGRTFFAPGNDPAAWLDGWWPEAMRLQDAADRATAVQEWWTAGRAPVLVIQGLHDRQAPPGNGRALARELGSRVTLVELDQAAHALLPEQPEAIARAVLEFLRPE